ncbi:hypothetical protein Taro_009961 [Colocasia esculenta]|uniref:Lon N-terminal domain-containing protein n=1 Tax=Colocasia esculenta TaxID=4460 RepID=A0A843U5J2_COLES|nr:hypothetical protein [Colocasia esculenta]
MELLHIPHSPPLRRCSTPILTPAFSSSPSSSGESRWTRLKRAVPTSQRRQEGQLKGLPLRPRCASSSYPTPASDVVELPLFPLPLVLFPGAILPLQIFEFRYRIMMHTLLETDLRFGVVFSDAGSVAGVGCVGEVVKHERLVDDRFFLICKGQERFRITRLTQTKPYLVAEVAWLEDRPPPPGAPEEEGEDLEVLATEVERYMKDVIRISNRLNGKAADKDEGGGAAAADLRRGLFPTPFSFFVGSTFEGAPREQQALLELQDTGARLRRERETLRNTLNYLTAASAVKDAFPSSPSSPSSSS